MSQGIISIARNRAARSLLAVGLIGTFSGPVSAPTLAVGLPGLGSSLTGVLGKASDSALTKLAQPGTYFNDSSIRIGIPGLGSTGSSLLGLGDKLGVTNGLTKSVNDAAGLAANVAKPVFRKAISGLSLTDAPGIINKSDGATQYLRQSAGTDLRTKVRPLIVSALEKTGAFSQLDKMGSASNLLSGAGLNRDGLSNTVTDQALNGIYKYIGAEEGKLRANPLGKAGSLPGGIIK